MREPRDIPVLLLNFNRPAQTKRALEALAAVAPRNFYAAIDGPRAGHANDAGKCAEVRELLRGVSWVTEPKLLVREHNMGCRAAVTEAISWFFSEVEFGIILEDDCLVDPTFFQLCSYSEERFSSNLRIMGICANNVQHGKWHGDGTFYFSRIQAVWGWATWRRAWEKFTLDETEYKRFVTSGKLKAVLPDCLTRFVWSFKIEDSFRGGSSWAFLWIFSILKEDGLVVVPNKNLVTNIGNDGEATHQISNKSALLRTRQETLDVIRAPLAIEASMDADRYFSRLMLAEQVFGDTWLKRIKNVTLFLLKRLLGATTYESLRRKFWSALTARPRPR